MLSDKFLQWLKNHYKGRGAGTRLAKDLGVSQPQGGRILSKKRWDAPLDALAPIAKAHQLDPWKLLKEIETEVIQRGAPSVVSLDEKHRQQWDALFKADRRRAERVLMNLQHQEDLGYTELVSEVVRLIIDLGPAAAAVKVAAKLDAFEEKRTASLTKLRRKLSAEYEEIDDAASDHS